MEHILRIRRIGRNIVSLFLITKRTSTESHPDHSWELCFAFLITKNYCITPRTLVLPTDWLEPCFAFLRCYIKSETMINQTTHGEFKFCRMIILCIFVNTKTINTMSKHISTKSVWVKTDGYRGYLHPINSVGTCNHTGSWEDSPCPTHVVQREIEGFRKILRQNKIRSKIHVTQSSNVFCQHVNILVHPDDRQRGLELSREYSRQEGIRLFWTE